MAIQSLDNFFEPASVAVIGASNKEGSVGSILMKNLLESFSGSVYPVNPNQSSVMGIQTHCDVGKISEEVDLALIATPAKTVPSILEDCGRTNIDSAIIVSSGFSEIGESGAKLERAVQRKRKKYDMRILGPNCLGLIRPSRNLNLSFARETPSPGQVAFISQSGAMGSGMLDWANEARLGFSAFVSVGNMIDVGFADLIDFFGVDPATRSICLYMETVGNPKQFISAARGFARKKPMIVLKGGKNPRSGSAVSFHGGSTPTLDEIYDAVFKRVGITRVETLDDLFSCSKILGRGSLPRGPNLAIITNAAGPAILALDVLYERGGNSATFSESTVSKLENILPQNTTKINPLDVLGDASAPRYRKCGRALLEDQNVEGLLVIYCPQGEATALEAAEAVISLAEGTPKPIITAWIGGVEARKGREKLHERGILTLSSPEQAVKAYLYMYEYSRNLDLLYETPKDLESTPRSPRSELGQLFQKTVRRGKNLLSLDDIHDLFYAYKIPILLPQETDCREAVGAAEEIGFPVRWRMANGEETIAHSDEQVKSVLSDYTDDKDEESVVVRPYASLEDTVLALNLGSQQDSSFGTILTVDPLQGQFGSKGLNTVAFPPLNQVLARRFLQEARVDTILSNCFPRPDPIFNQLQKALVRVSQFLVDFPLIERIDVGPVIVRNQKLEALEAKIIIGERDGEREGLHYPHLALAPYPRSYMTQGELNDGREVNIRPVKPEDEPLEFELFDSFSEQTWIDRFFCRSHPITHKELIGYTNIDYRREMAMVGILDEGENERMIGIARLIIDPSGHSGEYAVVVGDPWQNLGLGTQLTRPLIRWAGERNLSNFYAFVRENNQRMLHFCRKLGFVEVGREEGLVKMNYPL